MADCTSLKASFSSASSDLSNLKNELARAEASRDTLTPRHSELTRQIAEYEAKIARIENELYNADGSRRTTLAMELDSAKRDRDYKLSERGGVDGDIRRLRSVISQLQSRIAETDQKLGSLRYSWQQNKCEGSIDGW